jgi:hypothetical protein
VTIKTDLKRAADRQVEFNELMREAYDKPWWRAIMVAIKQRRDGFVAQLVNAQDDQRTEDRLRGQINELNFFITLDEQGRIEREETNNGIRRES